MTDDFTTKILLNGLCSEVTSNVRYRINVVTILINESLRIGFIISADLSNLSEK